MSRLISKIREFVTVNGKVALAHRTGTCERTVARWVSGKTVPPATQWYRIARQCDCTHEEALEIAQELPEGREKAS